MPARRTRKAAARQRPQAERYREAARLAIDQLDWTIDYLYRIHKPQIAKALRRNRNTIVKSHGL